MRIAFFSDTYLPNVDGVVKAIVNYRKEMEKRGHEVFILCPGTKKQKAENTDKNVYYFTSASFKPYPDYRIALFPFSSAVKKVKEFDVNLIHSHGIATTGLAAIRCAGKLKVPAVASFHTLIPSGVHYLTNNKTLQGLFTSIAWKYLKWYYPHFKTVFVPTNYIKTLVSQHGIENTIVNPIGIDRAIFNEGNDGSEIREKYKLKKQQPIILHVGRVALEKNIEAIIDAAPNVLNIYPNAKFIIVGKGPAEQHYTSIVNSKGLSDSFIFTGYVDDALLPKFYAASDVFVFPSTFDTQGLVVLEALSTGVPAVVRHNSASAEFIEDGKTGYVFMDQFDLPSKIVNSIKNKEELGKNASESSKKFDFSNTVSRTLEFYESLIKK